MERKPTSGSYSVSASLTPLLDLIVERAGMDGVWTVSSGEILERTGISAADYYRVMYGLRSRITFSDGIDGFSDATAGELVTLLEAFFGDEAEKTLSAEGLFLPHIRRVEATDIFIAEVQRVSHEHRVDYDTFWRMVEVFRDFGRAFSVYLDEYFPTDRLITAAAEIFRDRVHGYRLHVETCGGIPSASFHPPHSGQKRAFQLA